MQIDVARIKQVYSGKANRCCCGCAGNYYEDERNKRRIAKLLQSNPATILEDGIGDEELFSVEVGNRLYIAYLTKVSK